MKTLTSPTERAFWKLAQNPQDPPAYTDPALPPASAANDYEARKAAWSARRLFQKTSSEAQGRINCQYCQDRHYVMVYEWWAVEEAVPHPCDCPQGTFCDCGGVTAAEVDALLLHEPLRGSGRAMGMDFTMVPCDCHSGFRERPPAKGGDNDPIRVKKFDQIFGKMLAFHWLGDALLAARMRHLEARMVTIEPPDLTPDPPTPAEPFYCPPESPVTRDHETIRRRQAEQARVLAQAEAERIEIVNLMGGV